MLVVLRQRNFALLWVAGFVSLTGDWAVMIALPVYVYQVTGSASATAGVVIAGRVPSILLGSVAGVFVDRWDRRRTMIVANLLRAPLVLALLAVRDADDLWLLYLIAVLVAAVSQFFGPAESALLPRLVGPELLVPANALNALNNNLARLIGPPVGGLIAGAYGLAGVALVDAASFLIAALLIAAIAVPAADRASEALATAAAASTATAKARAGAPAGAVWATVWRDWRDGLARIGADRPLTTGFGVQAIASIGEGFFSVLFVVFVAEVLGGGAPEFGLLVGAQAVGGVAGAALLGALGRGWAAARLLGWGAIGLSAIDLLTFNYPAVLPESGIVPGLVFFVLVGLPATAYQTGLTTLLQLRTEDAFRGRVFGAMQAVSALLMVAGSSLAGPLHDRFGVVAVLNGQALAYILAGVAALLLLGGGLRSIGATVTQQRPDV